MESLSSFIGRITVEHPGDARRFISDALRMVDQVVWESQEKSPMALCKTHLQEADIFLEGGYTVQARDQLYLASRWASKAGA